jgi:hypothetical protein
MQQKKTAPILRGSILSGSLRFHPTIPAPPPFANGCAHTTKNKAGCGVVARHFPDRHPDDDSDPSGNIFVARTGNLRRFFDYDWDYEKDYDTDRNGYGGMVALAQAGRAFWETVLTGAG